MENSQSTHPLEEPAMEPVQGGRLSLIQWIVIAAAAGLLITFGWDGFRAQIAKRRGISDARRDIRGGNLRFRVGGKPSPWFDDTAAVFRERFGADLVHSYGCMADGSEWHYDSAYNKIMSEALAKRSAGFRFNASYQEAVEEGARRLEARLGQP